MTSAAGAGGERRGYHHGDLRRALLDAALELIREKDVGGVSLRAIARRVGVTNAAPYHHFPNKSALLREVAAEGFRKMAEVMEAEIASLPEGATPIVRLEAMGRAYVRFAVAHPAHYRVMFREDLDPDEESAELTSGRDACFGKLLATAGELAEGSPERAQSIALTAWSCVHGLSSLWNDGALGRKGFEGSSEELARVVTGMVGEIFGNEGEHS
ncbi:MAG: TetR/AcrR family transcriptional regulator [Acidobacteriota bacterium]